MTVSVVPEVGTVRLVGIDRLRGLAVLLMVIDHLLIVVGQESSIYRFTVTRLAMPLFFVVAGALVSRIDVPRLLLVATCGALLPILVPWTEQPNVLVQYVMGVLLLGLCWFSRPAVVLVLVLLLGAIANRYTANLHGYDWAALPALVLAGWLAGRETVDRIGRPLSFLFEGLGRYPLSIYFGHLLLLRVWELYL